MTTDKEVWIMRTNFGKFCQKLRVDKGELLFDMAQHLGVSSAFLSKVENGRAKPPITWCDQIGSYYGLSTQQKEELEKCITEAREKNIINLDSMDRDEKDMVFAFARKLDSMDEKDKAKWKELLNLM